MAQAKPRYAAKTVVTPESSQAELLRILKSHGADDRMMIDGESLIGVQFRLDGWVIRQTLTIPSQARNQSDAVYAQIIRTKWRVLILIVKSKLEIRYEANIPTERVFFADLVLTSGLTVIEESQPRLQLAKDRGQLPESVFPNFSAAEVIELGSGLD